MVGITFNGSSQESTIDAAIALRNINPASCTWPYENININNIIKIWYIYIYIIIEYN